MYSDHHRNQYSIFLSSAFSSIISTLVTNPIEVAKTNIQYYPLNCPYYPHKSTISFIQNLFNLSNAVALIFLFKALSKVSK